MSSLNSSPRKVFTPIILFITTAIIAFVLLVVSLVIWVAEMIKSGSIAALIVGGLFLVVSLLIYMTAARKSMDYLRDRLDTIYDVAYAAQRGYRATIRFFSSFFSDFSSH